MKKLLSAMMLLSLLASACGGGSSADNAPSAAEQTGSGSTSSAVNPSPTSDTSSSGAGANLTGTTLKVTGTNASGVAEGITTGETVPDGFPMPMPSGANVTFVVEGQGLSEPNYVVQYNVDASRLDELIALYTDFLDQQGMTFFGDSTSFGGESSTHLAGISILDSGATLDITLNWAPNN